MASCPRHPANQHIYSTGSVLAGFLAPNSVRSGLSRRRGPEPWKTVQHPVSPAGQRGCAESQAATPVQTPPLWPKPTWPQNLQTGHALLARQASIFPLPSEHTWVRAEVNAQSYVSSIPRREARSRSHLAPGASKRPWLRACCVSARLPGGWAHAGRPQARE